LSQDSIKEYIQKNKWEKLSIQEQEKIKSILNSYVKKRKYLSELNNSENLIKAWLWEISKEDYKKIIDNSLKKEYDFNQEKEIIEKNKQIEEKAIQKENDVIKKENWDFELKTSNWNIDITEDEYKIIKDNETAKENLISFKETLKELKLDNLWEFRKFILPEIRGNNILNFDTTDWDFLSRYEIMLFLKSILRALSYKWDPIEEHIEIPNIDNMNYNSLINLVKDKNEVWVITGTNKHKFLWTTKLEELFRTKFYPRNEQFRWFRREKFREAIKPKF
jgi:hypothetical protein